MSEEEFYLDAECEWATGEIEAECEWAEEEQIEYHHEQEYQPEPTNQELAEEQPGDVVEENIDEGNVDREEGWFDNQGLRRFGGQVFNAAESGPEEEPNDSTFHQSQAAPMQKLGFENKPPPSRPNVPSTSIDTTLPSSDGYDPPFMEQLLRVDTSGNSHWNLLFQGGFFTNAGRVGSSDLPRPIRKRDGTLEVPPMYVKDIVEGAEVYSRSLDMGENGKYKLNVAKMSFRKFSTQPLSLGGLFAGYKGMRDKDRFIIHPTVGQVDASVFLHAAVNSGNSYELVMPKHLMEELVTWVKTLNRKRAYASCEIAHVGGNWYGAKRLEMLGHEEGFADTQTKTKALIPFLGGRRYLNEYVESRRVGAVRSGKMLEEYESSRSAVSSPFVVTHVRPRSESDLIDQGPSLQVQCDELSYTIHPSSKITGGRVRQTTLVVQKPFSGLNFGFSVGRVPILEIGESRPLSTADFVFSPLGATCRSPVPVTTLVNPNSGRKLMSRLRGGETSSSSGAILTFDLISESDHSTTMPSVKPVPVIGISGLWYSCFTMKPYLAKVYGSDAVPQVLMDGKRFTLFMMRDAELEATFAAVQPSTFSRGRFDAEMPLGSAEERQRKTMEQSESFRSSLEVEIFAGDSSVVSDLTSLGMESQRVKQTSKSVVTYKPDGSREEYTEFDDGSCEIKRFPPKVSGVGARQSSQGGEALRIPRVPQRDAPGTKANRGEHSGPGMAYIPEFYPRSDNSGSGCGSEGGRMPPSNASNHQHGKIGMDSLDDEPEITFIPESSARSDHSGSSGRHSSREGPPARGFRRQGSASVASNVMKFNKSENCLVVNGNGVNGKVGRDGFDGTHGTHPGERGRDGKDGTMPEPGEASKDIDVQLCTKPGPDGMLVGSVKIWVSDSFGPPSECEETFPLDSFPTIRWSAKGGNGGDGSTGGSGGDGCRGADVSNVATMALADGGYGGEGGSAGHGTSGADGGRGGHVRIEVSSADAFLLMALSPRMAQESQDCVRGGGAGLRGVHGKPGMGGLGGHGGVVENPSERKFVVRPGGVVSESKGRDGLAGNPGTVSSKLLVDGRKGDDGTFVIEIDGVQFAETYDLTLGGMNIAGEYMIDGGVFEYGSLVRVTDVEAINRGGMPLPLGHQVTIGLSNDCSSMIHFETENPSLLLDIKQQILPGEGAKTVGDIGFCCGAPMPTATDFDPIETFVPFELTAMMNSPAFAESSFSFPFPAFQETSKAVLTFKHPIENYDGIQGLRSLSREEVGLYHFSMKNIGLEDLGHAASAPRHLAVRFSTDSEYENGISYSARWHQDGLPFNGPAELELDDIDTARIPLLAARDSTTASLLVQLGHSVPLYSRVKFEAELLLQNVRDDDLSVVQRRSITLVCEPEYQFSSIAHVVLVTSRAMTTEYYNSLVRCFVDMGLVHESFSLSRYASLDPDFEVGNVSLRRAFAKKLVVVVTDKVPVDGGSQTPLDPLRFFPRGCMEQVSGFDPSTRWMLLFREESEVGRSSTFLETHLLASETRVERVNDIPSFRNKLQASISNELESGQLLRDEMQQCYEIRLQSRKRGDPKQAARSLSDWLSQSDRLRQYTVAFATETTTTQTSSMSKLRVYRKACRSRNSGFVVYNCGARSVGSSAMMQALAESLNPSVRANRHCRAIRDGASDDCLEAFEIASAIEQIREVLYMVDAELNVDDEMEDCFKSIGSYTDNIDILTLIRDCEESVNANGDLVAGTTAHLSRLLGRFEAIAKSKDLRPRLAVRASKKSMHDALVDSVQRLRRQWRSVSDQNVEADVVNKVKEDVRHSLGGTSERAGSNWLQALLRIHSTPRQSGESQIVCKPLIEFSPFVPVVELSEISNARSEGKAHRSMMKVHAEETAMTRAQYTVQFGDSSPLVTEESISSRSGLTGRQERRHNQPDHDVDGASMSQKPGVPRRSQTARVMPSRRPENESKRVQEWTKGKIGM